MAHTHAPGLVLHMYPEVLLKFDASETVFCVFGPDWSIAAAAPRCAALCGIRHNSSGS